MTAYMYNVLWSTMQTCQYLAHHQLREAQLMVG